MKLHKIVTYIIAEENVGIRLDKALSTCAEISSRSQATSLIDRGLVTLDNKTIKPAHKTSLGEAFVIQIPDPAPTKLVAYDFPLDIFFEDEHLIVVNKPPGLVVHPAFGHDSDTLVNALIHRCTQLSAGFEEFRPGLVHRIDKDTSGLIVVAKDEKTLQGLALQFRRKETHRIYRAVTYGLFKNKSGTITTYLRRHPTDRKRFSSELLHATQQPTGRLAITHYDVLNEHSSGLSLVQLKLETGRTHQIRVHLSEMHHPIVGDPVYCGESRYKSVPGVALRNQLKEIPHMLLLAAELGFTHPITKKQHTFSVDWPLDLRDFLGELNFL